MEIYRERLTPTPAIHLALMLLLPLGFGMLAPIDITAGIANAVLLFVAAELWLTLGAPLITVTETTFTAGRATIERNALGKVTVIPREERLTAIADARAWKLLRAWVPDGIVVEVTDQKDPVPYWYVSTRNPTRLAEALTTR